MSRQRLVDGRVRGWGWLALLCMSPLFVAGCAGVDIVNQPLKTVFKTRMQLTSNVEDTEFRIRDQRIDAGTEEGWRSVGTGKEVTVEVKIGGRYEVAARPRGYEEKRVKLTEPVKSYPFTFVSADRIAGVSPIAPASPASPPAIPPTAPPNAIRNVYVLVIGIRDYRDANIPKLRYTDRDARAVYEFFKSSPSSLARPENVHYVGDTPNEDGFTADKDGITRAMSRYLINQAVHKDDMAIFYFSGHGDMGKHPTRGSEYYLIPKNADKEDLFATAIELSEFQRLWTAIAAGTRILIADACNSGGFSGLKGLGGVAGLENTQGEAKAVFSACKSDQKSIEVDALQHGLFTHVLMEGLRGKADKVTGNNDGRVTLSELKRWLHDQVPLEARKHGGTQTPLTSLVDAWGEVYLTK